VDRVFDREIIFSQGAKWQALISRYIGAMPLNRDIPEAEHKPSPEPSPRTQVSTAMIAKAGVAARCTNSAAALAVPSSLLRVAVERAATVSIWLICALPKAS
jgi:hypothetical protein